MLQGATEMLLGEGPKMAVAVDRFLTCAHALSWPSHRGKPVAPKQPPSHPWPWRQDRISPVLAEHKAEGAGR
jgi:hypothetical protein